MRKTNYTLSEFSEVVHNSTSWRQVKVALGLDPRGSNYRFKQFAAEHGVNADHLNSGLGWSNGKKTGPRVTHAKLLSLLVHGRSATNTHRLKGYLFRFGIKEQKCERCLLSTWLMAPAPLQLHHLDGDRTNNTLGNLQILCPNCHSQTGSFAGRKNKKVRWDMCLCGKKKLSTSKVCRLCNQAVSLRKGSLPKINWPPTPELLTLVSSVGFCAAGRTLGVSDNAIRRHLREKGGSGGEDRTHLVPLQRRTLGFH